MPSEFNFYLSSLIYNQLFAQKPTVVLFPKYAELVLCIFACLHQQSCISEYLQLEMYHCRCQRQFPKSELEMNQPPYIILDTVENFQMSTFV